MSIMPSASSDNQTSPRKAIPKRIRYEILRRDNHTCRYCHATDAALTIDHVVPVALGGTNDPSNLVAACKDCNAGKTSSSPDASLVAQVSDDTLRWAAAMRMAVEQRAADRAALDRRVEPFVRLWAELVPSMNPRYDAPEDWAERLDAILAAGLPMETLLESTRIAFAAKHVESVFYYTLGIATNKLGELQERARVLLARGDV